MLDLLVENSMNERSNLITEGIDAEFYQAMVTDILKDRIKGLLGHHIAEVIEFKQPTGIIFARKENPNSFEIIKKTISVSTNKTLVKISQEAWDDLLNLSNQKGKALTMPPLFMSWVKATSAHKETLQLIKLLKNEAKEETSLVLTNDNDALGNSETNLFYITKKANDLIIKMNEENFRTYDGFCILPQKSVGGILSLSATYSRIVDQTYDNRANDYFIGKVNNINFYLNPNKDETYAIVGLKSLKEKGVNSLIYSPYNVNLTTAVDSINGERTIGIFTRNAYTINPLHSQENPMLYKFPIEINQ